MWAHWKYACQSCWPRNSKSYREATRKLSTALETEKHRGVQVFSWWFLSLYPNFITHHLPFKYFFFLLWSGYNLYCRMQHTTEAPLQVQSCSVKHKAFQPQALLFHTPSDSIPLFGGVLCLKIPCLYLVPLETQHFQDQWNCFSSLTPSPVKSPIILYPQTSLLPLWCCLLLLFPLKLWSLWQSTLS